VLAWRSPEEVVELGFARSSVVLANEAHSGLLRCRRTREIGRRLLPAAHRAGVRRLAMEALTPDLELRESGYLARTTCGP
jgi:hypothetical protein